MTNDKTYLGEKWKKVELGVESTNSIVLEISNFGRVRSTTRFFSKRILKGSMINGYKNISLKLFEPRSKAVETRLAYYKKQMALLNKRIAETTKQVKTKGISAKQKRDSQRLLADDTALLNGINAKYKKEFRADELSRTINKAFLIHKLVGQNFCRKPNSNYQFVIHLDYNKLNNKYDNLKWATQAEVTQHSATNPLVLKAIKARRGKRIEGANNYKLTESKVMIIKKRIAEGKPLRTIAKQFKVSETQILRIKRKINWANVKAAM
ncbi:MAG: hypothetical protein JNK61_04065 [Bacteroidia bacterium]|nr:hypothetical protein [Bacteroidia bacterium]HQV00315.1 NUMOD4 domain-containing protein [Bacteroidia bacterium]